MQEYRAITWAKRSDVFSMVIVVVLSVVFMSIFFVLIDYIINAAVKYMLVIGR
jgi:preprotein translocase SecE subunit